MMKIGNKPKSIGQFIIDLTPLLDVIFLLLMVVLSYQDLHAMEADKRYEEAEQILEESNNLAAETEAKYNTVYEQLDTYENLNEYVNVVTIYASYTPSNRKYRKLYVAINSGEPWEREINPSNEGKIWKECQEYIEGELASNTQFPTIISVQNDKMLYRDEESILTLYDKLDISNKYLKNYMEADDV